MTVAVEVETRIARSPADVFAELSNVQQYPAWLIASGIVAVERLDDGPVGVGSRLRIRQAVAGRSSVLEGAVTRSDVGSAFGLRVRDAEGVTIELAADLGSDDVGTTRLRWTLRMNLPLRYRLLESMVAQQAKRAAGLDLEAFRRRLESAAG